MAILALGVSHRRATVELLEQLAFTDDDFTKAYRRAQDDDALDEAVILSTCNRVEIYASVPSYHAGFLSLKRLLAESRGAHPDLLTEPLYSHYDEAAAQHLFAVAAGLDSMVLGEPQILAQVREAHRRAAAEGAAGHALTALFHAAARAGRRVRSETGVGAAPDAFVEAGAHLAEERLAGLAGKSAAVVGAGQMAALAVKHLRARGVGPVRVLNRSLERARALAERTSAEPDDLAGLPGALAGADLLVSATGAAGAVIHHDTVAAALNGRTRPLFVLDLAVPRDVEPSVAELDRVTLVDIEGLRTALATPAAEASEDIRRAEAVVAEELHRFAIRQRSERLAPVIRALRERGDDVLTAETRRFRAELSRLTPDERDAVEAMARGIVAKLLHEPIVRLKELSTPGTEDLHARMLADLFGLDPRSE
ncbi:MAG TPA: glutamyl-tRNA reductase [Actinomycetota bacterium]|jgi:glutamyl-tRNA reductase|nr:glutamyl-tRNA reductase [Actinomycetota bacterium]